MRNSIAVFGIFPDQLTAEDGVDSLKEAGFRCHDISVLFPDNQQLSKLGNSNKAPDAVVAGGTGAVIGGALGWLAGIGVHSIPGAGPFVVSGPLMGMLGGMGAGAALGSLTSALCNAGIPADESQRYEGRLQRGSIFMSVQCADSDRARKARLILQQAGAEDVSSAGEVGEFQSALQPQHA